MITKSVQARAIHDGMVPGKRAVTDLFTFQTTGVGSLHTRYAINFVDVSTSFTTLSLMQNKSADSTATAIKDAHLSMRFQELLSDNGLNYKNKVVEDTLRELRVKPLNSVVYTPQQVGAAENSWSKLSAMVRPMLKDSRLPPSFAPYAMSMGVFIRNRVPKPSGENKGITPYELFHGKPPPSLPTHPFGCQVSYQLHKPQRKGQFGDRSERGIFIGYCDDPKAFQIYNVRDTSVIIARTVVFHDDSAGGLLLNSPYDDVVDMFSNTDPGEILPGESVSTFPFIFPSSVVVSLPRSENATTHVEPNTQSDTVSTSPMLAPIPIAVESGVSIPSPFISPSTSIPSTPVETFVREFSPPHRHTRLHPHPLVVPKDGYTVRSAMMNENDTDEPIYFSVYYNSRSLPESKAGVQIPRHYLEAMSEEFVNVWGHSIKAELENMVTKKTFLEVDKLPSGAKILPTRWVFDVKTNPDGSFLKAKSRLVARGDRQRPGLDFDPQNIKSSMIDKSHFKLFLAYAVVNKMKLFQLDVKAAFLNSTLSEELYINAPDMVTHENKLYRLLKSIYGLKQAGHDWEKLLSSVLFSFGLKKSTFSECLWFDTDRSIIVVTHVDDLGVAVCEEARWKKFVVDCQAKFTVSAFGPMEHFLGYELNYEGKFLCLSQTTRIRNCIENFGMSECIPANLPMTSNRITSYPESTPTNLLQYQSLMGYLNYICHARPELLYICGCLSGFMSASNPPTVAHMNAARLVLRHLKKYPSRGLVFDPDWPVDQITTYVDADFSGCKESYLSHTGVVVMYGNCAIDAFSKKQALVSLSSCESEIYALTDGIKRSMGYRHLLEELLGRPVHLTVYEDNQGAIEWSKPGGGSRRTCHIGRRERWIAQEAHAMNVKIEHISSKDQVADILTKPSTYASFWQHSATMLGIRDCGGVLEE